MEMKINQLACVVGGSFMETIKQHSKIAIGVGVGIGLLVIVGVILIVALKKKKKNMVQSREETLKDWEYVSGWFRNEKGEIMIWV
jgi:putative Mn2+ efflux pump MntP